MSAIVNKIERTSFICGAILAFIFCIALYIRTAIPYDNVFTDYFVRFGVYDPWYNMRLVENTLHHFPYRISFDPFSAYPHGVYNPFGAPLFDMSLAFVIWLIGFGNPLSTLGQQRIEAIAAWYPAVLGALTLFPVYFIGKGLYNRTTGLIAAALIAILPGQFLARSLLGYTDHHAMETLLSTIAMLFFILALKSARENDITFYSITERDWSSLKKPIFYSLLAGFFIGLYSLAWMGAPLIIFILLIYALVQYITDHLRGASTDYLCILSMPVFIIPLVMIEPALSYGFLLKFHRISLILGIIVFLALAILSFFLRTREVNAYWYPLTIFAVGVISFLLLKVFSPDLYSTLTGPLLYIFAPSGAYLAIAEVEPMGWNDIIDWFYTTFFIALAALVWIVYNISKKFRPEEVLFVVWSAVILLACFGQNRFAAYYAVNVAVLCGFFSWKIIEFAELGEAKEKKKELKKVKKAKGRKSKGAKSVKEPEKEKKFLRTDILIAFAVVVLALFFPLLGIPGTDFEGSTLTTAKSESGPQYDWYESLSWMRNNTPDPGVDYYALYAKPATHEGYNYPESAYSVMNWWDYGHWITRIAHRIPVANNFQQGIGGPYQSNSPGACVFFTATNETDANKVADALDTRYVVSGYKMVDFWNSMYNKFGGMMFWSGDTEGYYVKVKTKEGYRTKQSTKFYNTMEARLHLFDGSSTVITAETIPALQHYRLVHESPLYIIPFAIVDEKNGATTGWQHYEGDYQSANLEIEQLHRGIKMEGEQVKRTPEVIKPVSFVKVFEYVKGARIEGKASDGSIVLIATNVTTSQGREFVYSQRTVANGSYVFIVPYSTGGPIDGATNFDVFAQTYKLKVGHIEDETLVWKTPKAVEVTEEDVMEGKSLSVDLMS